MWMRRAFGSEMDFTQLSARRIPGDFSSHSLIALAACRRERFFGRLSPFLTSIRARNGQF